MAASSPMSSRQQRLVASDGKHTPTSIPSLSMSLIRT